MEQIAFLAFLILLGVVGVLLFWKGKKKKNCCEV